ncbi:methyl-accepting chemotaxis protein [Pseudoalteromonas tunicata]|uniref:methyl-accepting chemotaxis protein n=1 Tax=Pseudoalteromonas tunicata TaxID=314281 RepID=UPI00273D291E|nr:methyl-accepting chemotaxis protein [Pseudoalteromonas tunicata]MDP5211638.1 methyl-accepting chemotaxis protein [Pseudoalteromonas tunicata]
MRLKNKLLISFLSLGIIPASFIAIMALLVASNSLEQQAYNQLTSIKSIKKVQIEDYFAKSRADLAVLEQYWQSIANTNQSLTPSEIAQRNDAFFQQFINEQGYYDFFVINMTGDVVYTVAKEADYQSNLISGPYARSGLAQLFSKVTLARQAQLLDFSPYAPSNNEPAAFIGLPVIEAGKQVAVIALQLSIEKINHVMQQRNGMGETGESYLVGPDLRMRSDSFLDPKGHSVIASFAGTVARNGVDTKAVREGLEGVSATEIVIDYNGNPVLSAYTPIEFMGMRWVLLAEIDEAEAFAPVNKLKFLIAMIVLLTVCAVVVVTVMVANSIIRPLGGEPKTMQEISERIALGDLSTQFEHQGRLSGVYKAMQIMSQNLHNVISNIVDSTGQLSSTAAQTSAASVQANSSLQEQHLNIASVTTAMHEMAVTIDDVANNARNVAELSLSAQYTSEAANNCVRDTINSMQQLANEVKDAADVINNVESQSQKIGSVLEVIQQIAEQTNLLALNAAIEAARAGDQGRGFAVVADEVRQLAQKTQQSTRDIEQMIAALQTGTSQAVTVMSSATAISLSTINNATSSAHEISRSLSEIRDIAQNAQLIATAAQQQACTAEEINQSMESINQAAVDNAAGADQVSAASIELNLLAEQLKQVTMRFKLTA